MRGKTYGFLKDFSDGVQNAVNQMSAQNMNGLVGNNMIGGMNTFQFDPNNMYNGLSAGPWIQAEDKTPEELDKQRSRSNRFIGIFIAIFGIAFGILGIVSNQMVLSLIGLGTFGVGALVFFVRPNKYDLSNACMIDGRKLSGSCSFYQIAYSPTTRRRVRDSDGHVRTETDTNYIRHIFMNPQDDRKWYIIYAYDNNDNNGVYINGIPTGGWRDSKRMILLETQGKQARLLIPDNMSVFMTIANMMGFNYTDNRIKYEGSDAWLIDTFNDMDGNGVEDNKENGVTNTDSHKPAVTIGGYSHANHDMFDNGYNTNDGYDNPYGMNNNGYNNMQYGNNNGGIYHNVSFGRNRDNDRRGNDYNNDGYDDNYYGN